MENNKKIGIWMDYSQAVFVDPQLDNPSFETLKSIKSAHSRIKGEGSNNTSFQSGQTSNNEYNVHQKEISDWKHYVKVLTERLQQYNEILLSGPGDASRKLLAILHDNKQFQNKKITWEKLGKMTDNQLLAHVKNHFFKAAVR